MREWWEHEVCDEYDNIDTKTDTELIIDNYDPNNNYKVAIYKQEVSAEFFTRIYTTQEKKWLCPIAETLAMLDGNAFFGSDLVNGQEWYEQYLPEAAAIFYGNGGPTGWAGEVSWMKEHIHETSAVEEAYNTWKTLKILSQSNR